MRRNHVQAVVELKIWVSKKGDVESAEVVSGSPQLADAAIEAVKQRMYDAFMLNGEPVRFQTRVDLNFSLAAADRLKAPVT
jgi:TonB family protein